jgi:acyl-coenzyme A thioesterase PaaI-like protein
VPHRQTEAIAKGEAVALRIVRAGAVSVGRGQTVCRCEVFDVDVQGAERLCALAQGTFVRLVGE